jgi:TM2 domain-containing membrane protein YozV
MTDQRDSTEEKYPLIAYFLWGLGFVGFCGLHRMYLGQYTLGTAMLFTFGLCGVGQLVDVAIIPEAVRKANGKDTAQQSPTISQPVPDDNKKPEVQESDKTDPELDEWDLEQASIEESLRKLKE